MDEVEEMEEVLEEMEGEQVLEALPEALPLTADTSDIPATSRAKKKLGRKWSPGIIASALPLKIDFTTLKSMMNAKLSHSHKRGLSGRFQQFWLFFFLNLS